MERCNYVVIKFLTALREKVGSREGVATRGFPAMQACAYFRSGHPRGTGLETRASRTVVPQGPEMTLFLNIAHQVQVQKR